MMALQQLAPRSANVPELQVSNVAIDSRQVTQGALFMAMQGAASDGHDYIDAAVENGAVAVFAQRLVKDCPVPLVVIEDLASRVSQIAGEFYQHPSRAMQCVAVTGTNGKTSVAHFVARLADRLGLSAGFLGTTGWGRVGADTALKPTELTTADAVALQQQLAALKADQCELVALELSSHALQQHRGDALGVDVALFTNLTRDHLDYHGSMTAYGDAKARLFDFPSLTGIAINGCDEFGAQLVARCLSRKTAGQTVLKLVDEQRKTRSAQNPQQLLISKLAHDASGMHWQLDTPWGRAEINTPVIGGYNAFNLSLAVAALALLGHDLAEIAKAVPSITAPAGRLERVLPANDQDLGFSVFVDYAHTPDALASVLEAARAHCESRLLCVFGCGGDRDKGKRAPMGQVVHQFADVGFLTSDNPRFEEPSEIIADVEAGLPARHHIRIDADRRAAINAALLEAKPGDMLVIAGKGHEDYQEIKGVRQPFDDVAVAREALDQLARRQC